MAKLSTPRAPDPETEGKAPDWIDEGIEKTMHRRVGPFLSGSVLDGRCGDGATLKDLLVWSRDLQSCDVARASWRGKANERNQK